MSDSTKCDMCREVTEDDSIAYQSDRDMPSDLSEDEADDNYSDDDDEGADEKQSDDEAAALFNDLYGSDTEEGGDGEKVKHPEEENVRRPRYNNARRNRRKRKHRSNNSSYVRMATGKKYRITTPKPRKWHCNPMTKTVKITLRPHGKSKNEFRIVEKEMNKTIVGHPHKTFNSYKIIKLQKLINGCQWSRYRHRQDEVRLDKQKYTNQRMLFHGSASIDTIVENGFNEQFSKAGGMFGYGIYFAKHSSKSNQYAFGPSKSTPCPTHSDSNCFKCERKLLLCRVTLGKTKNEYTENKYHHPPPDYHSVTGVPSNKDKGLKYPEYIIYRHEQAYPEYLITYKISK